MSAKSILVLLVEDDPADVELTREALLEGGLPVDVQVAGDGEQAMAYLRRQAPYAGARRPDVIFLDLNMPRKDGREVMRELRADPHLRSIPVIVITTSDDHTDISRMYDLGANCYLTKPADMEEFSQLYRVLESFWFKTVKLPPRMD